MDDYISRQQAIKALSTITMYKGSIPYDTAAMRIEELPSVTDKNVGTKLGTNLAEVGTDCISRKAAIDAFNTNLNELVVGGEENAKTVENYLNRVLDKIKCLPSAQPEPKRGKWIYHIDDLFPAESTKECDQCHAEQPLICDDEFCPHCGAKMEVTE